MTAHARKRAAQMAAIASCPECKHNVGLGAVDHTCELEGCCAKKDCMCQNDWHDWFELEKKVDAAFARMNVKSTVIATYD